MFGKKEEREYFYRCVYRSDMTYLSPRNREAEKMSLNITERMKMGFNDKLYPHPFRFKPADALKGSPADILQTEREIAWYFTEEREKMVSRPMLDKDGYPQGRRREQVPKFTKIKFELIENPSESERERAIPLKLRDMDYADAEVKEPVTTEVE